MSELLRSIIEWATELLRADAGAIYLWDPERRVLTQSISFGFTEEYTGVTLKSGEGLAGRVFHSAEPAIVEDYAVWEGKAVAFESIPPYTSVLQVAMKWRGKTIGVLGVNADSRMRTFDQNDVRLATLFANVAAVAITNARLYETLEKRTRKLKHTLEQEVALRTAELSRRALQLETSARVSREITSILDIDELLTRVAGLIRVAFRYCSVLIFLVDREADLLTLRAASGESIQESGGSEGCINVRPGNVNREVRRTNKALMVNDVSQETLYSTDELPPSTRSELVVPLRVGEKVIGTLDVHSHRANAFSQEDVLVIQSLGDQVAIAIENARLYDRSRELAVLEERNRLARELHDSVTQSLFSLDLHAKAIATYLKRDPEQAVVQVNELRQTTHDALRQMRSLIYDLRPSSLDEMGLASALQQQIERRSPRDGPVITLHVTDERRLPDQIEQGLFRVAQEALRNAIKHSGARHITVALAMSPGQAVLSVKDDGRGFDVTSLADDRRAFGLIGMRERAELLDGSLEIESQPGAGTRVEVRVPT